MPRTDGPRDVTISTPTGEARVPLQSTSRQAPRLVEPLERPTVVSAPPPLDRVAATTDAIIVLGYN